MATCGACPERRRREQSRTTSFAQLARLCHELEGTSKRTEKVRLIADFLRGLSPKEVKPGVLLIIGRVFAESDQQAANISGILIWQAVQQIAQAPPQQLLSLFEEAVDFGQVIRIICERYVPTSGRRQPLTLLEVYARFGQLAAIKGRGSQRRKEEMLIDLLRSCPPLEVEYLVKNLGGEMRIGVNEGLMLEAIAHAAEADPKLVRRANMLSGDLGAVAEVALARGERGLKKISTSLFVPLKPMLAKTAETVAEAWETHQGQIALEYKLDGARVQIHKQADKVRIYSRQLAEVTLSLPEVVEQVKEEAQARDCIFEGEVIPVDKDERPRPFQELMRRFRRIHDLAQAQKEVPVRLCLFDLLYADGRSLIDLPYQERWQELGRAAGDLELVARTIPRDLAQAETFLQQSLQAGHEGVMAKRLDSLYAPGVRGKGWLKVKSAITLDLIIVAADWGYGRRHGWLSNYHLAAKDEETGRLMEVGKTFKGLTDAEFQQMTQALLDLKTSESGGTVQVEPKVVVEVSFNQIQRSPHYECGMALRFARIKHIRWDKNPDEIDTIQTIRQIFQPN